MAGSDRVVVDLSGYEAVLFDFDGVITRTATVHAAGWKDLFDEFLDGDAVARARGSLARRFHRLAQDGPQLVRRASAGSPR